MGRAKETVGKKDVRSKQLKKRKEKEKLKQERKEKGKSSFDDMIAWVDENGQICSEPPSSENKPKVKAEDIEISVPKGGGKPKELTNRGKVNNFDKTKGFGFINVTNSADSLFFHISDCIDEVTTGDKVTFETEKGPKGLKAAQVKKVV